MDFQNVIHMYQLVPVWFLYVILSVFSLCIGSFLNVVIHRLPLLAENDSLFLTYNLIYPRSQCTICQKTLPFYANIPIISYLYFKGQCLFCKTSIHYRYPLIEFITALGSIFLAYLIGFTTELFFFLLFFYIIICMIAIDMKHLIIPDSLNYSLLWLGLIANLNHLFIPVESAIIGAITGYLSLYLFVFIYYLISNKWGMGHGDFKLFAAFGAWFGITSLLPIVIFSCFTGAVIGGLYLLSHRENIDTPIPFGPFLCISGFLYPFFLKNASLI